MPRPDSRFKRIIAQVLADVKKITTANGYATNFKSTSVKILPKSWKILNSFPYCYVTFQGGSSTKFSNSGGSKRTKVLRLVFFLRDTKVSGNETINAIADLETDLEYLWYEVNPSLREDSTNDALVTKIKIITDLSQKLEKLPYQVYTVDLQVVYHDWWNR